MLAGESHYQVTREFKAPGLAPGDWPRTPARPAGWMSGQIPLSREGVDSYRAAARDLPDTSRVTAINVLATTASRSPNRDRAIEMTEAMAERERRELDELEHAAAARPEFAEAIAQTMEDARKRLKVLEQWTEPKERKR